jgi:hypothetical protein
MAHLNTSRLVLAATDLSHLGYRASHVAQDPAVQKAWKEAGSDFAVAANSIAKAVTETRTAWRRTGLGGGAQYVRLAT